MATVEVLDLAMMLGGVDGDDPRRHVCPVMAILRNVPRRCPVGVGGHNLPPTIVVVSWRPKGE
jgi:hypothetical protein